MDSSLPDFAMPVSKLGRRVWFSLRTYDPVLDSANMTHAEWARIAK